MHATNAHIRSRKMSLLYEALSRARHQELAERAVARARLAQSRVS
jgi:hypothetical protein